MAKQEMMVYIAAVLTALHEEDGFPESTIYLCVGSDIEKSNIITTALIHTKLITVKNHWIELTEKGKETAIKLQESLANSTK